MAVVRNAKAGLRAVGRGATVLQLRNPHAPLAEVAAEAFQLARDAPVPLVVNSRVDLALAVGSGVHLPEGDLGVTAARRLLGNALIGRSVHDLARALEAAREGADYLVLGPVYATPSHPGETGLGPAGFRAIAAEVPIPVLAIGGLDAGRAAELGGAGYAAIRAFA